MLHWEADSSRVLIVDDSEEQVGFLRRVLRDDGYRCSSVDDGREAVDACLAGAVDIVLLDVHLPGIDGLTVCRQLKAAPETCLIPVLIMTGAADQHARLRALEAGSDDFLQKPIALAELRARLHSASRMKRCVDELDNAAASLVMLGATIEARDRHTNGHCRRLAEYASALGQCIGLDCHDRRALEQGGYIHDLGKIAIADAVLFKPGPLTRDEYDLVKTHPLVGDRICAPLRTLERARPIIRSHHETLDGRGYPDGLRGTAIPLLAQVTAVADVYDALTTDRPYRSALAPGVALDILWGEAKSGKRDPSLVGEFASLLDLGAPAVCRQHALASQSATPAA
jgi:putative two-component system response regulator